MLAISIRACALAAYMLGAVSPANTGVLQDVDLKATLKAGDTFIGEILVTSTDILEFEGLAGERVSVAVKAKKGAVLKPAVAIRAPDSSIVAEVGTGKAKIKLKKVELPLAGVYQIHVTGLEGTIGEYKMTTSSKLTKAITQKFNDSAVGAGLMQDTLFEAKSAAPNWKDPEGPLKKYTVSGTIFSPKKSDAVPSMPELTGPGLGPPLELTDFIEKTKGGSFKLTDMPLDNLGNYTFSVKNAGLPGVIKTNLTIKKPKLKKQTISAEPHPNILLIIGDDIGVDRVAVYGEHPNPGNTPNLDALAAQGTMFRNAWAYDTCSPTRAAMLTGRHARRTGIGTFILTKTASVGLPATEISLADVLAAKGYRTAAVGKWHLSAARSATDLYRHPLLMGFEHHWGPITNLPNQDGASAYYDFEKNIDGVPVRQQKYATTDQVDDTLNLIEGFGPEPWFIWLAFSAPHKPLHAPPAHLHSFDLDLDKIPTNDHGSDHSASGLARGIATPPSSPPLTLDPGPQGSFPPDPSADEHAPLFVKAMTEAMDTEIGRLFASMDPATLANTYVIFVGDNGTNGPAISPPWDPTKGKSTVFEGGINVPLIVTGPTVLPGQESPALVHAVDLFATIADLARADTSTAVDSASFSRHLTDPTISTPEILYGERFRPNGFGPYEIYQQVARNGRFKYMRYYNMAGALAGEDLYDLETDAFETDDLMMNPLDPLAFAAFQQLSSYMDSLD